MIVVRKGFQGIAVIDPQKKFGEEGQYVFHKIDISKVAKIVDEAKAKNLEVRYYFKDLSICQGEVIPCKIIMVEIPPGHIHPFHYHENIYEITTVDKGEIIVIDSDDLNERQKDEIFSQATVLSEGDVVIHEPGKRHTQGNRSDSYVKITTIQVARVPSKEFKTDWIREK